MLVLTIISTIFLSIIILFSLLIVFVDSEPKEQTPFLIAALMLVFVLANLWLLYANI